MTTEVTAETTADATAETTAAAVGGATDGPLAEANAGAVAETMDDDASQAWVYILRCSDGSFYTGQTIDLEARLALHQAGRASKYTRSRLPVEMVFTEDCSSRSEAMSRERRIKNMTRQQKAALIQQYRQTQHD